MSFYRDCFILSLIYFFVPSKLKAGDLLAYTGTLMSTVAAASMAVATVRLSEQANTISERQTHLEERAKNLDIRPFVLVTAMTSEQVNSSDVIRYNNNPCWQLHEKVPDSSAEESEDAGYEMIQITFSNTTRSFLTLEFKGYLDSNGQENVNKTTENNVIEKITLAPGESGPIALYARPGFWKKYDGDPFFIELILENRFAERYQEDLELIFFHEIVNMVITTDCTCETGPLPMFFKAQNYRLGRFTDDNHIEWEKLSTE